MFPVTYKLKFYRPIIFRRNLVFRGQCNGWLFGHYPSSYFYLERPFRGWSMLLLMSRDRGLAPSTGSNWFSLDLVPWGGVRLSALGTSATNWPIVPAPDDRGWWMWSIRWNEKRQGKPKYSEKTCPSATLSTTNPTWPDLGSSPGRRGSKPVTNRLSYGTALGPTKYAFQPRTEGPVSETSF
jgi:hypothetical protein